MTQQERVLKYLEDFGSITPREAFNDLGVYRLSAVIYDLRDKGFKIDTETEHSKNRYGEATNYARYVLHKNPVQQTLF